MGAVNRDRVLGSLAGYVDGFAEDLARQRYSSSVARSHGQLMQHLSWWMACSGLAVSDLDMVGVDEYLRWRRETGYVRGLTRKQIEPVIGYLRRVGAAPPAAVVPPDFGSGPVGQVLGAYAGGARGSSTRWGSSVPRVWTFPG